MLSHTARMIERDATSTALVLVAESRQRRMLGALDDGLDLVEQLLLDERPQVPLGTEAAVRRSVAAVDARLAFDIDRLGADPIAMLDIIYSAQAIVMEALGHEGRAATPSVV